ncbi:MAG TPA: vitamin K epoxide reductase family protein [Planktothrix sp.]|jgi:hypothetical protein
MISQSIQNRQFKVQAFSDVLFENRVQYEQAISRHNYKFLWTYAANCILGLFLLTSPYLYNYDSFAMVLSDTVAGTLIILIEYLSFSPKLCFMRWGTAAMAVWLLFAPLIFWAPRPATFLIDTIVACFAIVFSVLVPGMPGRAGLDLPGPDIPPGWSYNPSSWIRRWLGIALSLLGFFIARYMAAYQLGYIDHAVDPFFGRSSEKVLTSVVSRSFPISDAGFGSVAYILEAISGFMGDRARWRTAPFLVLLFAVLVLPLGATSIMLVIMQPVIVGAWCGLCLIAATGMMASVPLAVHELIAMGQFLLAAKQQRRNFWNVFWMGGSITGGGTPDPNRTHYTLAQRYIASVQGVTIPWMIGVQLTVGAWLMARPDLLPADKISANCDHILGAVVITAAAIATAEVTRTARLFNVLVGALLIVAALAFNLHQPVVLVSDLVCAALLIPCSIPRGEIVERYAGWHKFIK